MLRDLPTLRNCRRGRASSYDRTGRNADFIPVAAGESALLADIAGPGRITHIWCTLLFEEKAALRELMLRAYWDDENDPSVSAPIGDFFGVGHGLMVPFTSIPLTMSAEDGRSFNCFFPMPFGKRARFELVNEGSRDLSHFYFYIDYELYDEPEKEVGYFHALFNRQNPCDGISEEGIDNHAFQMEGENKSGDGNYTVLDATGRGLYVGCTLNIFNLRRTKEHNWYGEGDDMIFIDGDRLPTLHGTGTEDYFNMAFCPTQKVEAPYHGLPLPGGENWAGPISMYRFHIDDPVWFQKSIRVTIEHGHANRRSDDYSSVAYWYQAEPHRRPWPEIKVQDRIPHEEA